MACTRCSSSSKSPDDTPSASPSMERSCRVRPRCALCARRSRTRQDVSSQGRAYTRPWLACSRCSRSSSATARGKWLTQRNSMCTWSAWSRMLACRTPPGASKTPPPMQKTRSPSASPRRCQCGAAEVSPRRGPQLQLHCRWSWRSCSQCRPPMLPPPHRVSGSSPPPRLHRPRPSML